MEQIIATGNIALAHAFKKAIRLSPLPNSSPMYPDSQMKAFPRFQRSFPRGKIRHMRVVGNKYMHNLNNSAVAFLN